MSLLETSFGAIPRRTNSAKPNGGCVNEVCMFTHGSTPNHPRSMPGSCATGASSGTMTEAISKKSRKNARKNANRLTTIRTPTWVPPVIDSSTCSIHTPASTPWNISENTVEPIRMKVTTILIRIVDVIPCRVSVQVSRRFSAGKNPSSIDTTPKNSPSAASENATWNPTSIVATRPPDMIGAMVCIAIIAAASRRGCPPSRG